MAVSARNMVTTRTLNSLKMDTPSPTTSAHTASVTGMRDNNMLLKTHYPKHIALCILYTQGKPSHHDLVSEFNSENVKWVPLSKYLEATRTGVIFPKSQSTKAVKLLEWRVHPKYRDVQLAKSVVEALCRSNPQGQIMIVKPENEERWAIPRQQWYDNNVKHPLEAFTRGISTYTPPHVKLCQGNVLTWNTETCSRDANGEFQEIIPPCTYELFTSKVPTVWLVPQRRGSLSTPSDFTVGTPSTRPHSGKLSKKKWGDMSREDTSSDEESSDPKHHHHNDNVIDMSHGRV